MAQASGISQDALLRMPYEAYLETSLTVVNLAKAKERDAQRK